MMNRYFAEILSSRLPSRRRRSMKGDGPSTRCSPRIEDDMVSK